MTLKDALSGKSDAGEAGYRPLRDGVKETAMATKDDDAKVTLTTGDKATATTLGGIKKASERLREATTVEDVQDLLSLHDDEKTTRIVNERFSELRKVVDRRASEDEKDVSGEMTIVIKYKAISVSGIKEITVPTPKLTLPKERPNTRKLYETPSGALQTIKPTKQIDMFEDKKVVPIRKGV